MTLEKSVVIIILVVVRLGTFPGHGNTHFKLGGRESLMSKTVVRKNESLDDALRRFKRSVSRNGTLREYRKREFYEKPSVKRKLKSEAARKRKNKRRRRY